MLIQSYQENWAEDFQKLKAVIHAALPNLSTAIEHVGSTAVPGLAAKAIIDIDIVFDKSNSFEEIKTGLGAIGYYHNGDQGIAGREAFKRNPTAARHAVLDSITHHLYVCRTDSRELQKHILFRDWLLANADARIDYEKLKYQIARAASQDKKQYAVLKEIMAADFINNIVEKANAALSGSL